MSPIKITKLWRPRKYIINFVFKFTLLRWQKILLTSKLVDYIVEKSHNNDDKKIPDFVFLVKITILRWSTKSRCSILFLKPHHYDGIKYIFQNFVFWSKSQDNDDTKNTIFKLYGQNHDKMLIDDKYVFNFVRKITLLRQPNTQTSIKKTKSHYIGDQKNISFIRYFWRANFKTVIS